MIKKFPALAIKNMMNFANIINIKCDVLSLLLLISIRLLLCNHNHTAVLATNLNSNIKAEHKTYPEQQVTVGSRVSLPCEIVSPVSPTDSVTLILWYRGDDISGAPIYSVDARARNTPLDEAKHFISEPYEGRVNFDIAVRPAMLTIDPIVDTDLGRYWCRVDFRWTRTSISMVSLNVIVPPKRVIITDDNGVELKSIATFDEGSDVKLFCEAIGGNPLSSITWYRNNRKLKTQTAMIRDNNTVVSGIIISGLARGDINSVIKCHAANGELTKPVTASITIDINLRPLKAHIISFNRERLTVGRKVEAICHTYGSRPSARVSWLIGDKLLTQSKDTHLEGNGTKSALNFVPTPSDNGMDLVCRAENPKLSNSAAEDRVNLNVRFMPNVTLSTGSSSAAGSARAQPTVNEGSEILLDCDVQSNPRPTRVRWLFNRKELRQDVAKGIIITNSTLVVKNARRESEGRYQCVAYNSEGRGDSGELFVQVFYAPHCTPGQQRIIETSLSYPTNVFCQVDAKPDNVTFHWIADDRPADSNGARRLSISSKSVRSKLTLVPQTGTDFGRYACWASNSVGDNQLNPCVFNVTDSGQSAPKPVTDCSAANVTAADVTVVCQHSRDHHPFASAANGLLFHLMVRDSQTLAPIANQTNADRPTFTVANLSAASIYQFVIYASNPFGVSDEVTMIIQTLPAASRSTSPPESYPPIAPNSQQQQTNSESPHKLVVILVSLLACVMIALSILIAAVIVCLKCRRNGARKRGQLPAKSGAKCRKLSATVAKSSDDSIATSDSINRTPDVIPCDGFFFNENLLEDTAVATAVDNENGFADSRLAGYRGLSVSDNRDDYGRQLATGVRGILTNHVSVISEPTAGETPIDDRIFVTNLDTFVVKYRPSSRGADVETSTTFLPLATSFPQTTPV